MYLQTSNPYCCCSFFWHPPSPCWPTCFVSIDQWYNSLSLTLLRAMWSTSKGLGEETMEENPVLIELKPVVCQREWVSQGKRKYYKNNPDRIFFCTLKPELTTGPDFSFMTCMRKVGSMSTRAYLSGNQSEHKKIRVVREYETKNSRS